MAKHKHIKLNKALGQHFLNDQTVLHQIVDAIEKYAGDLPLLEVGPGGGSLTAFLIHRKMFKVIEFDERWVAHLKKEYPNLDVIHNDFLQANLNEIYKEPFAVVGNFPYNISSQILFRIIEFKEKIPVMVGMFQKEVALRICSDVKARNNGILSILTQLYYDTEYLFDVPKEAFNPPPKVVSGVMQMTRKKWDYDVSYKKFRQIVKMAFNQRRKTLRNSLKPLINNKVELNQLTIFNKRPEELTVEAFVNLTNILF